MLTLGLWQAKGLDGQARFVDDKDVVYLASIATVPQLKWRVIVLAPEQELFSSCSMIWHPNTQFEFANPLIIVDLLSGR